MDKNEIEYRIQDLKAEYVRLQNDLEKLESVKGNVGPLERQITEIENELRNLNQKLREI